jgi:hypothetical protein
LDRFGRVRSPSGPSAWATLNLGPHRKNRSPRRCDPTGYPRNQSPRRCDLLSCPLTTSSYGDTK